METNNLLQMFNVTNYDEWKFRLNIFLEMKECHEVINNYERPEIIPEVNGKRNN